MDQYKMRNIGTCFLQCALEVSFSLENPDIPEIADCIEQYFLEMSQRLNLEIDRTLTSTATSKEMMPPMGAFIVARIGGRLAGFVGIKFHEESYAELKRMWVRPENRGKGIARKLIELAERYIKNSKCNIVRLETHSTLTEALNLYKLAGYRDIGRYSDDHYTNSWLEKRLIFRQ